MALLRLILLGLTAAVAACASVPATSQPNHYVLRHLQKAEGNDPGLTEVGRANAEALAGMLDRDPPSAIYVSATRRARETAAPTARRYGLTAKEYDPRDTPALIARVQAEPGTVLIVGHSNTVPEIVAALGGGQVGPLSEQDYGDLFYISGPQRNVVRTRVDFAAQPDRRPRQQQ